jgi:hypothetical protein
VVTVLVSPLFAFAVCRIQRISVPRIGRIGIILIIVGGVVMAGVFSPSVSMPARTDDSFVPAATDQDIALVKYAAEYVPSYLVADSYLASYARANELARGERPTQHVVAALRVSNVSTASNYYRKLAAGATMAYQPGYRTYYEMPLPSNMSVIYDSGEDKIIKKI